MPSPSDHPQGSFPPKWEHALPTAVATVAVVAGTTAALQLAGRLRGGASLAAVEVGAAFACAAYLTWRYFRDVSSLAATTELQSAPTPPKKVAQNNLDESESCCGGAWGCTCSSDAAVVTEEQEEEGEADLEDLQGSDDEFKKAARAANLSTYLQPKASRQRALSQLSKEDGERGEVELSGTAALSAAGAAAAAPPAGATPNYEGTFLPGRSKIYFKTFGCSHNVSDSEYMQGLLHASGYRFVETMDEADICVVNSCTVKSPSEFALYSVIRAALGQAPACSNTASAAAAGAEGAGKKRQAALPSPSELAAGDSATTEDELQSCSPPGQQEEEEEQQQQQQQQLRRKIPCVVTGCVPGAARSDRRGKGPAGAAVPWQEALLEQCSIVGVSAFGRIVEVVEEALQGRIVRLTGGKGLPPLDLPKIRRNRLIEIVPISTGCLGNCTYCKTKHARGDLGSYPEEAIEARVRSAIKQGATQIWLTSEDTGAYGLDIGSSLTQLLRRLLQRPLPEEVMLRVGMGNPPFLLGQLGAATDILGHPNVFEFLHLPVQSGSNSVLSRMKRDYTVEQFRQVVDACLQAHPRMSIMTDIICGFPGETEEDHLETLRLLTDYRFPAVNISQFYPRPNTPAAAMKQLNSQVVKRRSREATQLFESYTCYDWMVGTVQKVWFSSHSDRSEHTVGHTKQYVKILVDRDEALLGKVAFVRVISASKWHCMGALCGPPDA